MKSLSSNSADTTPQLECHLCPGRNHKDWLPGLPAIHRSLAGKNYRSPNRPKPLPSTAEAS
eukprot:9211634-Lingulodinium_polyedra.AAC.1